MQSVAVVMLRQGVQRELIGARPYSGHSEHWVGLVREGQCRQLEVELSKVYSYWAQASH